MGMLDKRSSEEQHRQARLGLSNATWGNIIATRYSICQMRGLSEKTGGFALACLQREKSTIQFRRSLEQAYIDL